MAIPRPARLDVRFTFEPAIDRYMPIQETSMQNCNLMLSRGARIRMRLVAP